MRYKTGDKIKIIANTGGHGFSIGSIVVIDSVYKDYYYSVLRDNLHWAVGEHDCERATRPINPNTKTI